jgi:hypothetical protein
LTVDTEKEETMKSLLLALLAALSFSTCSNQLQNSAWELSGIRIKFDNTTKTSAINQKVKHDLNENYGRVIYVLQNDTLYHMGLEDEVGTIPIRNITPSQIIYQDDGKKGIIDYDLSEDQKALNLAFSNGNTLQLKRINLTEELKRKVAAQTE